MKAFRASAETAAAIAAAAERDGVSQSEIIRSAVEARLGCAADPAPEPDVYELVVLASKGELQAQRDMMRLALAQAMQEVAAGNPRDAERSFIEALLMARLAAAHGNAGDQGAILAVMSLADSHCPGLVDEGDVTDMLARLDLMADASVPNAADALGLLADSLAPERAGDCLAGAKEVRLRLRDEMEAGQ